MFNKPFYNKSIRNFVIAFGALFSQVKVLRHDNDNSLIQTVGVPIAYGPKEKIFVKLRQDPTQTNHIYTILPRMAFEIVGYNYDADRAMNKMNQIRCYQGESVSSVFSPAPYDLNIQLNILTKGAEDGFAIVEQILPVFRPNYSLTVNSLPELQIVDNIPITLNGVTVIDDYEGDFSIRRLVTHTLDFTAKINIYGPVSSNGVITRTDTYLPGFAHHVSEGDLETGEITADFWMEEDD